MSKQGSITEKVDRKIAFEWELFRLKVIGTTRENIFSVSDEITLKRKIIQEVKHQLPFLQEETLQNGYLSDSIIESIFSDCYEDFYDALNDFVSEKVAQYFKRQGRSEGD